MLNYNAIEADKLCGDDGRRSDGSGEYARSLGVEPPHDVKTRPLSRTPRMTRADQLEALAGPLPLVTKCPPGVARNALFFRMKPTGNSGSMMWQDISTALAERQTWGRAMAALSDRDRAVLEVLPRARNMTEVGIAGGLSPSYARNGGGIRILQAANDNLAEALRQAA